jgi:pimeloyl-ACP methyl ester carboxylesterase
MHVVLVHGMGRTPLSMLRLARTLRRAGHGVSVLGYVAAVESFGRILGRIASRLGGSGARGPYAVVGHSMGGLLARAALAQPPASLAPPAHLIMLGTPNQPPRLAQRYHRLWTYRRVNGECGQLLARTSFYTHLPPVSVRYTIIAGTGGSTGRRSPFGDEANDGVVAVSETLVSPADRLIIVPVRHTFMMNDSRVRAAVLEVLEAERRALPPDAGDQVPP